MFKFWEDLWGHSELYVTGLLIETHSLYEGKEVV
jgi:hypothetical protein